MKVFNVDPNEFLSWKNKAVALSLNEDLSDPVIEKNNARLMTELIWTILKAIEHDKGDNVCVHCGEKNNEFPWEPRHLGDYRIDGDGLYCYLPLEGWAGTQIHFCPWCGRELVSRDRGESAND